MQHLVSTLWERPPTLEFTRRLRLPLPCADRVEPAYKAVLLLVLLTGALRCVMAYRVDVPVPDAAYYLTRAQFLAAGDFERGFSDLHLNVYPILIAVGHALGLGWETAGEWVSVAASILTVLPLYGWVRRQFNEQIALAAGLMYACHPQLIEWSPEILRDPLFWLFFMLTLYCGWRALTEIRWQWFLGAGIAWTLAVHTRSEGWGLLLPLASWLVVRWRFLAIGRWRLAGGVGLGSLAMPALILLVNFTWLHNHPQWETGRFNLLERLLGACQHWPLLKSGADLPHTAETAEAASNLATPSQLACAEREPATTGLQPLPADEIVDLQRVPTVDEELVADGGPRDIIVLRDAWDRLWERGGIALCEFEQAAEAGEPEAIARTQPHLQNSAPVPSLEEERALDNVSAFTDQPRDSTMVELRRIALRLFKAFGPIYGVLFLVGAICWKRNVWQWENAGLFALSLALTAAVIVYQFARIEINSRYFFPLVLMGLPTVGAGLLATLHGLYSWTVRKQLSHRAVWLSGGLLTIIFLVGPADAWSADLRDRRAHVLLGRWIRDEFGTGRFVSGSWTDAMVGYHAEGVFIPLPEFHLPARAVQIRRNHADVILVWGKRYRTKSKADTTLLTRQTMDLGYQQLAAESLPPECRHVRVFVRDGLQGTADRPLPRGSDGSRLR